MINLQQELQNYPAINLESIINNNSNISDDVKNSIILYNKALESLRTGSEDIAIIELKRSINMNPNFHEAMNLLGLCYSCIREYTKAKDVFEKVVAAENNSVKAMRYLSILNTGDGLPALNKDKVKLEWKSKTSDQLQNKTLTSVGSIIKNSKRNWISDIPKYAIGFIGGAAIVILVTLVANYAVKTSDQSKEITGTSNNTVVENSEYKSKYLDLNNKYTALQSEANKSKSEIEYYKNAFQLFEADKQARKLNYEAAADKLVILKTINFKELEKEKFDELYSSVMPKAASSVLNEGIKLMNTQKYQEALNKLNKILVYGNTLPSMDRTLYNIGKCYMSLHDSRNAVAVFQQIKDKYPGSQYAKYADGWIRGLTQTP